MTIEEAGAALRSRTISSVELTGQCLRRIEQLNPSLNVFMTVTATEALAAAARADGAFSRGDDAGPLQGIPVAVKDLFDTKGVRTTYGSVIFDSHIPSADAAAVESLKSTGAVLLGKLGLHEFAYGITSSNPHFGPVRNPWNPECIPGGSSGGSGVAISTGMALLTLGTDTGGSIRIPSSFCGIYGLKPTFGRVSTAGCRPLSESLDHMGPMAGSVRDLALAMRVLTGSPVESAGGTLGGIRVGVPTNFFFDHAVPEVRAAVLRVRDAARDAGAEVVEVEVDAVDELIEIALAIILPEAADSVASLWDRRDEFGTDVRARFEAGRSQDPLVYLRAQRGRVGAARRFRGVFDRCDFLLTPATPTPAPRIGETVLRQDGAEVDLRLATTRLSRPINVLGIPSLALPCGISTGGLPIGAQLLAPWGHDDALLEAGALLEAALGLRLSPPVVNELS